MKRKASRKPAARKTSIRTRRPSAGPVVLASECLVDTADALKQELLRRLDQASPLSIDASHVGAIDTASLQLLAAFARDRRAAGHEVRWVGVPSAFADTARLLDLASMLGLPSAGEASPA
jgi:phospholipid transport system transporter-binding protein